MRSKCSVCSGTGRVAEHTLAVSNFRSAGLPEIRRDAALQLKGIIALARRAAATSVALNQTDDGRGLGFVVARAGEVLLRGTLHGPTSHLEPN